MASKAEETPAGFWHPAGTANSVEARLELSGGRIEVRDVAGGTLRAWAGAGGVRVSARIAGIPRSVTFPDGSVFETRDNDGIDRILTATGSKIGNLHRLEKLHPRLILFVAFVVLFAVAVYRYALPVLVEVAVYVTPPVLPSIMSSATLGTMDQVAFSPSKLPEARKRELTEGFQDLVGHLDTVEANYNLNFRLGGRIGPNAFALPDGTVVITDELVELAKGDDEMLLGVLAHEIGHVELKHSLRQLYRVGGTYALITLIAGDVGSGIEDILTEGGGLLALSYSREAEAAADRYSVGLMLQSDRDPKALGRFFKLLEDELGMKEDAGILSTHPGTPQRRQSIESYIREAESK